MEQKKVSKSVLKRLPVYLAYLKNLPEDGPTHISATSLAGALGMGEVQVRKDLAIVSDGGRPKIGYLRESLITDIEQFLGYDNTTDAVLIGAGKLGLALMGYIGFEEYGLNIQAAFDTSPTQEKTEDGKPIYPISKLEHFCKVHKGAYGHYHRSRRPRAGGGRSTHCLWCEGNLEFCACPPGCTGAYSGAE